jgi:hypothetical protein
MTNGRRLRVPVVAGVLATLAFASVGYAASADGRRAAGDAPATAATARLQALTARTAAPFPGFVLDRGRYVTVDVPGAEGTAAGGINDRGQAAGTVHLDAARAGGRALLPAGGPSGPFTPVVVPGSRLTVVFGIDNRRRIVGGYSRPGTAVSP